MKKLFLSKSVLLISLGVVLAVLSISNSCTKSSTDPTGGGGSNQPGANEVWLQNRAFTPATITVAVGTTVKWTNKDSYTHNVTSSTAVFTSGSMGNGAIFTFQFTAAGTYPYTCTLHPGMAGTVIVQ